mgnify:CR=1 FL=1
MLDKDYLEKIKCAFQDVFQENGKGKNIYLFPADKYTSEIIYYLKKKKNIEIKGILEWRKELIGNTLQGVSICSVEDCLIPFYPKNQIVIGVNETNEMLLRKLDFIECWRGRNCFILSHNFKRGKANIQQRIINKLKTKAIIQLGYRSISILAIERYLKKNFGEYKGFIYLFPHKSLGDISILGKYLQQKTPKFKEQFKLVVVGKTCEKIALKAGFDSVIAVSQELMDALLRFKLVMGNKCPTVQILHYDFLGVGDCGAILDENRFSFMQCYENLVFNDPLRLDANKSKSQEKAMIELTKFNIDPGRSVILAPECKSIPDISPVFWEQLALELKQAGLTVFTNCSSKEDYVIYGTEPLIAPIEIINEIVEECGFFVGIRSGLCDVISECNAYKVIIYPKLKGRKNSVVHFYAMEDSSKDNTIKDFVCPRIPKSSYANILAKKIINEAEKINVC